MVTTRLSLVSIYLLYERRSIEMEKKKYVYLFSEGDGSMRNLLGGKGANLAKSLLSAQQKPCFVP